MTTVPKVLLLSPVVKRTLLAPVLRATSRSASLDILVE